MSKRPPPATSSLPAGSFSRPLDVDRIPETDLDEAIEATEAERAAIMAELGLAGLDGLTATFRIDRHAGGRLSVSGRLQAAITQICVVSLDPFASLIERAIELEFAPQANPVAADAPQRSRRREPDREPPTRPIVVAGNDDQEDPPDPIVDGRIDLGAITLEFLTLSLDLYPRKPGVHFTDVSVGEKSEAAASPFAALQRLKDLS